MNDQYCPGSPIIIFIILITLTSCLEKKQATININPSGNYERFKPASSFNDTLKISSAAAVMYSPDSIQLEKIRSLTSPQIFDGQMHEYEYQLKYSKKVLHSEWPQIQVLEPVNIRFLLFEMKSGETELIDLNDYNDPYGTILFNTTDKPVLADMTNFEQSVFQHFNK